VVLSADQVQPKLHKNGYYSYYDIRTRSSPRTHITTWQVVVLLSMTIYAFGQLPLDQLLEQIGPVDSIFNLHQFANDIPNLQRLSDYSESFHHHSLLQYRACRIFSNIGKPIPGGPGSSVRLEALQG
jgi:hypothetical protein